jgi:ubiquinone/menaquinone biosynthesis C-methylase UbiE
MEGHEGWDDYAPFYDWENKQTLGRRDLPFWRNLALHTGGTVLELGCGTGRLSLPLARAGVPVVGVDRSAAMLAFARRRMARGGLQRHLRLVQADIRYLPFPAGSAPRRSNAPDRFAMVMAPYGILQSLLHERDLASTLSEIYRVLLPNGTFGLELVADLPSWEEYRKRVSLKGWRGKRGGTYVTLVESVRQDRSRHRTIFDQEFTERRGRQARRRRFSLAFRTLSVPQMTRRLERAGFEVSALLGDYRGGPWDERADVWIILARKPVVK